MVCYLLVALATRAGGKMEKMKNAIDDPKPGAIY
jgi:hypothetical protein